jgi:hypothetical protein
LPELNDDRDDTSILNFFLQTIGILAGVGELIVDHQRVINNLETNLLAFDFFIFIFCLLGAMLLIALLEEKIIMLFI